MVRRWARMSRIVASLSLFAVAFAGGVVPASAEEGPGGAVRLAGDERVATAVAVSRQGWTKTGTVVLARADDPADALTGSTIAGRVGGPLLITPRDRLAPAVAAEIRRLGARQVVILGGSAAVSDRVVGELRAAGVEVDRIAGANRYDTAVRAGRWLAPPAGGTVHLVGEWWDAVAVSGSAARAAAEGDATPILLGGRPLSPETLAGLRRFRPDVVRIVDGEGRIPATVDEELRSAGYTVERVPGRSRYAVSRAVVTAEIDSDPAPRPLVVATGEKFPDALGAGALAARQRGRLLLTSGTGDGAETTWLGRHGTSVGRVFVVGGKQAIPETYLRTLVKRPKTKTATPPATTGRSGLHFTPAELDAWRARAASGPYRTAGDAGTNTPGDWQRIQANARAFVADPAATRWSGPHAKLTTCVAPGDPAPPTSGPTLLRDAAFVALVQDDRAAVSAARSELLWHARQPSLDFRTTTHWCPGLLNDLNPGFDIANWLTKLLYAYDYLGPDAFTSAEAAELDRWFTAAARFFAADLDRMFSRYYVDRQRGDHRLSADALARPYCNDSTYIDGPVSCQLQRIYNNRRAIIARYVGLVGVHQDDAALKLTARLFVEEFLAFSVYPQGLVGEFERWEDRLPDLGWAYGTATVAAALTIADAFARAGDPGLYRLTTSAGALGTEGGSKSLLSTTRAMVGHLDGTHRRYAGDDPARRGDPQYLIDGWNGSWISLHDVAFTAANRWFRDPYLRGAYTRTGRGMPAYPASPASVGPHSVWTGDSGTLPGVLFMYAGLEDLPYPGR